MDDQQLLQFSRHIMLPDFDVAGQEKLLQAKVLLIGAGGLGSPIALYLGAAGVGRLTIVDDDEVDTSNLQRQIAHRRATVGTNKAESAAVAVQAINPSTRVRALQHRLSEAVLQAEVAQADLVIDATDNAPSRYLLNRLCWQQRPPLVSGAAVRWEGQVSVFDPLQIDTPCYECLYPESSRGSLNETCSETGVVSPLLGIIGSCQAMEGIKYLCGIGAALVGYVSYFDAKKMEWQKLKIAKRASCPTCQGN